MTAQVQTSSRRVRPVAALVRLIATTVAFGSLLFVLAGTVAWPAAWAYLGLMGVTLVAYALIEARLHPDLVQERTRPPSDAKTWDKPFVALVGAIGPLAMLVLCGLDRRYRFVRTALEDRTLRRELEGYAE